MKQSVIPWQLVLALFLVVFSVFLYVATVVVFDAFVALFGVVMPWQLKLLEATLFGASGSFIISTFLGMRFYNWFTRTYYYLASVWIGFFTYLFLISVTYGLILNIDTTTANTLGLPLIGVAILASIYGLFHARHITVNRVSISLDNLPASWNGRHAIWISDVHLGQLNGVAFAEKIVQMVNALPHDIVFIGGDLYDGTGVADITELVTPLGRFSGALGIYFITGNHEEISDSHAFVDAVRSVGIRPLINEAVVIDGLTLIGIDYRSATTHDTFRQVLAELTFDRNTPSILLKHEPKDIDVARDAGISLQISGHTHRAQLWPLGYIADLIYKGFAYGLKRSGELQVFTSSGVGTWGPPMRVGSNSEIVYIKFE